MSEYLTERYLRTADGAFPHMGVTDGDVAPTVLICGNPARVEQIQARFEHSKLVGRQRGHLVYSGEYQGVPVSVASVGMGCPGVAIAVEELSVCGGNTFIRVGSCASIHPELPLGGILIATAAVRDEGTSPYYAPLSYPAVADHRVVAALCQAAAALDVNYRLGLIRSTDSFYQGERDTETIDFWRSRKVWGFEMESSALFTIAGVLGLRSGTILIPGSNLITRQSTYQGQGIEAYRLGTEAMISSALDAVRQLAA